MLKEQKNTSAITTINSYSGLWRAKKLILDTYNDILNAQANSQPYQIHNYMFMGKDGTGKLKTAKILGQLFAENGVLKSGHVIEATYSSLVADSYEETKLKTEKVLDCAIGGILYVHDAYLLSDASKDENLTWRAALYAIFGYAFTSHQGEICIIFSGPEKEMEKIIAIPGIGKSFEEKIYFSEYSPSEMVSIMERMAAKEGYAATDEYLFNVYMFFCDYSLSAGYPNTAKGVQSLLHRSILIHKLMAYDESDDGFLFADDLPKGITNKLHVITATDWRLLPMPEGMIEVPVGIRLSRPQRYHLKMGHKPCDMDDKWFQFSEGSTVYFYRSWTGICSFWFKMEDDGSVISVMHNIEHLADMSTDEKADFVQAIIQNHVPDRIVYIT